MTEGSLAPVRAAIPPECYRRSTRRGLAYVARDVALYAATVVLLARVDAWWLVLPLELVAGLVVSALFILGHDASHLALVDDDRLNDVLAHALLLPALHVKGAWDLGHNRVHHGFTARQGMDFVWHPVTREEHEAMPWWQRVRHEVEWSALGSGLYYGRAVWWNKMVTFRPPAGRAKAIRRDWWLVVAWAIAVTTATVWWGGPVLWLKVVVGPFLVFTQIIGWTVHVHHVGPDIPWWTKETWTRRRAQTESTTILRIPRVLDVFFHHIFVHVPHHVDTRIPWYHLPAAATAIEAAFPGTISDQPFRVRDYLRSARACKLYDFATRTWSRY